MTHVYRAVVSVAAALFVLMAPSLASAQESKSSALAAELVRLLDAQKLDSLAAKVAAPDHFVAALYFPGSQLLVVAAKYYVPERMDFAIGEKKYRDVYIDLNSASVPKTKVFISDLGADGLQATKKRGNQPNDTADVDGKTHVFDGEWKKAKIAEADYMKTFQATDAEYVKMLEALVAQAKKSS
jgi:hypothetical protein